MHFLHEKISLREVLRKFLDDKMILPSMRLDIFCLNELAAILDFCAIVLNENDHTCLEESVRKDKLSSV